MLRLRHLRLTLLALFVGWALSFLKVIRNSSLSSASDAVPNQTQPLSQHHPLLFPKKPTKNDWSSGNRPDLMSLPKVDLHASDVDPITLIEYRPNIRTDGFGMEWSMDSQHQTLSPGFACETLPAQDPQDGGFMGYQVLKRMQFFLHNIVHGDATKKQEQDMMAHNVSHNSNVPQSSVLCVLADFTGSMQNAVLETYGQDCDGVAFRVRPCVETRELTAGGCQGTGIDSSWKVVNVARNQTTIYQPGAGAFASPGTFSDYKDIFRFLLAYEHEYTWIHWASPNRYVVPDFLRFLLRSSSVNMDDPNNIYSQPMVLESWNMDDPGQSKYTGLYGERNSGGCDYPRTFNQQTVRLLAHNCSALLSTLAASTNLTTWIDSCLSMHKPQCHQPVMRSFKQAPWLYLQRYYEIELATTANNQSISLDANNQSTSLETSYAASLHRVHAILHGICDPIWDRPLGALDKVGKPGYIHDPTFLKRNPLPFTYHAVGEQQAVCDIAPGEGEEGAAGYEGLRKIRIASDDAPFDAPGRATKKRVLCMVYTHSSRHDRLRAVAETWGPRCDGFLAASDQTDETIGAVHLLHEGPEHYRNMWLKVYAMWRYVYDHYRDDYDFFHIGGDDHYVIAENLRHTVSTGSWKGAWNDSEPLYLGGSLALGEKRRYCNGGSGYTLNRVALKMLVHDLFPTPRCWPHWQASDEDKIVASCFRSVGIQCMDTNDDRNETRYHTWNADQHADWAIGKPAQDWAYLPENHGIAWKEGLGQISETSVSFHLKKKQIRTIDSGMRRYHAILYGLCSNLTTSTLLGQGQSTTYEVEKMKLGNL
jgi:glycoprotein-N-acetylgalactosamine 3-beta-galactosyltransferase